MFLTKGAVRDRIDPFRFLSQPTSNEGCLAISNSNKTLNNTSSSSTSKTVSLLTAGLLTASFSIACIALAAFHSEIHDDDISPAAVAVTTGWADESRCVDCHEQAESFRSTGHANTLQRATDSDLRKLLEQLERSDIGIRESVKVESAADRMRLIVQSENAQHTIDAKWCMGSGTHARTWVSTIPDVTDESDLLEIRWTWFRSLDTFDVTPGQPAQQGRGAVGCLGVQFDDPRAWRCFACHSTHVPVKDGHIIESDIIPGVGCQRCHGPRQRHVASDGQYHDPAWIDETREEKVARCAECHRFPEEHDPKLVTPDNLDIKRFQPVGLSQSVCFQKSDMTCTTCHDPHKPMEEQDSLGSWQCIQCHDPQHNNHTLCAAGMTDSCVSCHMPKVKTEIPISFTDHWIRVRQHGEATP